GSDGSDGALTIAANQGTITFDPRDATRWGRILDPDGDGVYNFTTVTVGSGTILRVQGDKVNKPAYWLASGDVMIQGTIDLSGSPGISASANDFIGRRQVSVPGAGGYAGGVGGSGSLLPTPGEGPGGGSGGQACGNSSVSLCGK